MEEKAKKQEYVAPAVLEVIEIDMNGQILQASRVGEPVEFEEVEAMGQEVVGDNPVWSQEW